MLLLTSSLLAMLLARLDLKLARPDALDGPGSLPATLSPLRLRFLATQR